MNWFIFLCGPLSFLISVIFVLGWQVCVFQDRKRQLQLLKERLGFYAEMKPWPDKGEAKTQDPTWLCINKGFCVGAKYHSPTRYILSPQQHEVLLGILKKIELKSATTAAVFMFGLAAIVTILVGATEFFGATKPLLHIVAGILVVLIIGTIDAARHLGQRDYNKLEKRNDQPIRGRELQKELMCDVLKKEARYDASWWLAVAVILFLALAYGEQYAGLWSLFCEILRAFL